MGKILLQNVNQFVISCYYIILGGEAELRIKKKSKTNQGYK